jgi:hypothetical protein
MDAPHAARYPCGMSQAFVVTLEKDLPDPTPYSNYTKGNTGKAIYRESERLNLSARTKKVPPITDMLSESQAALIEQMKATGFDVSKMRLPAEQWFPAADGLLSVRALIEHVGVNLNNFKQPNPILRDLRAVETLLAAAEAAGVRFHFSKAEV